MKISTKINPILLEEIDILKEIAKELELLAYEDDTEMFSTYIVNFFSTAKEIERIWKEENE